MSTVRDFLTTYFRKVRLPVAVIRSWGIGCNQLQVVRYYLGDRLSGEDSDERHLAEAMLWLCRAQDACLGRGVSAVYDLTTGWGVAYPETSGYIIATYLAYADLMQDRSFYSRAEQIGDWEVAIQTDSGGILSHPDRSTTRVFNTGQVILGWCALYEATGKASYRDAAYRAGDYLVSLQETDGSWVRDTYCGARTYHARVDWALLRIAALCEERRFAESAARNLTWVLRQQHANGWFENCGFNDDLPIMHVIVYTLRGLLESHLTGDSAAHGLELLPAIVRAADALCDAIEQRPARGIAWLAPTSYDRNWMSTDRHSCLTGNAQLACFLFRLARTTGNDRYFRVAAGVLGTTKKAQSIDSPYPQIRGALGGSYPLYQGYHPLSFPNWATKFLADALIMKIGFDRHVAVRA